MTSLSEELLNVLREAEKAQQVDDDLNHNQAIDSLYRAACQLSYLVDLHVDKGSVLEQVCRHLVGMYQQHILMLRSKTASAGEAHWVQLETISATAGEPCHWSRSSETTPTPFTQTSSMLPVAAPCLESADLRAGLQSAAVGTVSVSHDRSHPATLASGLPPDNEGDVMAKAESQKAINMLLVCQRLVSGSLDDIIGLEEVKTELEEAIFLPIEHPYLFKGIRQPARTFLLYGPPGTGKTVLVEKLAAEANFTFLSLSPSVILSKWSGESEKAISMVFDLARTMQPAVLFMDEIDSIGQARGNDTDAGSRRLLTELLIQFNRVADDESVYIFAATNRMQDCDPALLRRFSRRIEVPLPNTQDRLAFLHAMLQKSEVEFRVSEEEMHRIAELTSNYSGSDLVALCRLAVMAPVRELFLQQTKQKRGCKRRRLAGAGEVNMITASQQTQQASADVSPEADQSAQSCHTHSAFGIAQLQTEQSGTGVGLQNDGNGTNTQVFSPAAGSHPDSQQLQVRTLVFADFVAALQKVRPAAAEALESRC